MTKSKKVSNSPKSNSNIDSTILDQLMADYNPANPESLIGKDGLLVGLKKAILERALSAELDTHLGYKKNEVNDSDNYRNGYSPKTVFTDNDKIGIDVPRDRDSSFKPQIISKNQTRFKGFDDKIISMYSRGMTVADIKDHLLDIYEVEVSHDLISNVIDAVIDEVEIWQNRPLDEVYPVIFLDCIVVKAREDNRVINKSVYLALGVNMNGVKEILFRLIIKQ